MLPIAIQSLDASMLIALVSQLMALYKFHSRELLFHRSVACPVIRPVGDSFGRFRWSVVRLTFLLVSLVIRSVGHQSVVWSVTRPFVRSADNLVACSVAR